MAPALLDLGVHGLRVLTEEPGAAAMRFGANDDGGLLTASVGVWVDSIDDRQPVLDAHRRRRVHDPRLPRHRVGAARVRRPLVARGHAARPASRCSRCSTSGTG